MKIVITGATGTIGGHLLHAFGARGDVVTVLTRDPERARQTIDAARFVAWDGRSAIDPSVFEGADVVYHLAGEPVAKGRWTPSKKRKIIESRVLGTRAVVDAIARSASRPVLVCASAVGFYGTRGDDVLTEASAAGTGFLADVCKAWEAEANAAADEGIRVTTIRIGVVFAREGGALHELLPLFRTGLAGRVGSGSQWMPWIHVDDVVGIMLRAARAPELAGAVNAVAPETVTNAVFTKALARALHRPAVLAAPAPLLRLVMGEVAGAVLSSQRVVPERALASGYVFRFPSLEGALDDLVGHASERATAQAR